MIEDPATHALRPFDFSHLMENVPKVKMLNYDIDNIQFTTPIDSSDMNTAYWQEIARSIADNYYDYDGFVVLHGTPWPTRLRHCRLCSTICRSP